MKTTAAAVVAALICFFIGNAWVFTGAEMFVQYFYDVRMVALTHVFTLGWVSLMIVGVLRQLAPVAFGLKMKRPELLGVVVTLWIPGLIAMVFGFYTMTYSFAALGTSLLLTAIVLMTIVLLTGFHGVRREPAHNHLVAAILYFAGAAVFGEWMALAKGFDIALPAPFHRVLFAHIHLAGAGWAGMMVFAVMSRLFPQPHLRRPLQARIRFGAFNVGLLGMVAGLLMNGEWYSIPGALLAIACIWYGLEFIPVLWEFSQSADRSTAFLIAAWICLGIVACLGLWFGIVSPSATSLNLQLQFVYGFLYMFGWLTFMIFGMLYRIIPTHISKFLTTRGISAAGIRGTFIASSLQLLVFVCLLAGVALCCYAIVGKNAVIFRIGWGIWLIGVLGFMAGLARLGRQLHIMLR